MRPSPSLDRLLTASNMSRNLFFLKRRVHEALTLLVLSTAIPLSASNVAPLTGERMNNLFGTRSDVAAAAGRSQSLAAWVDGRSASFEEVFATRLTPDGEVIDTHGVRIDFAGSGGGNSERVSVASDGRDFLVTYVCRNDLVCTRVIRHDGSLGEVFTLGRGGLPRAVWTGRNYVVSFARTLFTSAPFFELIRVGADGAPIGGAIQTAGWNAKLAVSGSRVIAVYRESRQISMAMFSGDLIQLGSPLQLMDYTPTYEVAASENELVVALTVGKKLIALHRDPSGNPKMRVELTGTNELYRPSVAMLEGRWVIAVDERPNYFTVGRIRIATVDFATGQGRWIDDFSPVGSEPVLVRTSRMPLILWKHDLPPSSHRSDAVISSAQLSSELSAMRTIPLSTGFADMSDAVACRGTRTSIAAWVEREGAFAKRRVFYGSLSGAPARVESEVMSVPASSADQDAPQVSCVDGAAAILWTETDRVRNAAAVKIAFLDQNDRPLMMTNVTTEALPRSAAAFAWNGAGYLVAFTRDDRRLVTVTLDLKTNSMTLPADVTDVASVFGDENPRLAWSGESFLIAWQPQIPRDCQITCPPSQPAVEVRLLDRNGAPLARSVRLSSYGFPSGVAWTGREFIIMYYASGFEGTEYVNGTFLRRIAPTGALLGSRSQVGRYHQEGALFVRGADISAVHHEIADSDTIRVFTIFDENLQRKSSRALGIRRPSGYFPVVLRPVAAKSGRVEFLFSERDPIYGVSRLFVSNVDEAAPRTRPARSP